MKVIDQFILSSYLRKFFSFFLLIMFVFIFQTIWMFIDDLVYAYHDNKFYTISSANKELTILNIENNEGITDESILFKINPLSFLKKFRDNNNIVFEETNNRYIIRYILEQEKYNLFFEKNFDLANIEIIYKNSEISNKIFFSKTRNVNTERYIKIDLNDYKDYYVNEL